MSSFKEFSSAQGTPGNFIGPVKSASDNSKDAPATAQPVAQPDKKLAGVTPVPKS